MAQERPSLDVVASSDGPQEHEQRVAPID